MTAERYSAHASAFSRRGTPGLLCEPPSKKQRAQGKPGVRCTRSLVCSVLVAHECSHHRSPEHPASLRNGFNGFLRALPGDRALLPPSPALLLADLTPATGRQDHTTSSSALAPFVKQRRRVHRIPLRVDDVAQRPSVARDMRTHASDLPDVLSEIFFVQGIDSQMTDLPVGQSGPGACGSRERMTACPFRVSRKPD
jgi:hypothetical protein